MLRQSEVQHCVFCMGRQPTAVHMWLPHEATSPEAWQQGDEGPESGMGLQSRWQRKRTSTRDD